MVSLGFDQTFMDIISGAYNNATFVTNLKAIKTFMKDFHASTSPMFDDIEAEITCLLIMQYNLSTIYDLVPCGAWSTLYLLKTLDIRDISGTVHSYTAENNIESSITPLTNLASKWVSYVGDVSTQYVNFTSAIDLLFIDCDTYTGFAEEYVVNLLTPLLAEAKLNNKKIYVMVHDVFHGDTPDSETASVISFLTQNNILYFAPRNITHSETIATLRAAQGLDTELIHQVTTNPAIFFILE